MIPTDTPGSFWPDNFALLIPAYKAGAALSRQLPELTAIIPKSAICIVDDGSNDNTSSVCQSNGVQYLSHAINRGKGAALRTGFSFLLGKKFSWILTIDADNQHAISDIPLLVEEAKACPGAGIILGARTISLTTMPLARIFSNTVTSAIISLLCKCRIPDSQCGFRVYSSKFLETVSLTCNRFELESEALLKASNAGFPVRSVPVQTLYCSTQSHISHLKDTTRWVWAISMVWLSLHFKKR